MAYACLDVAIILNQPHFKKSLESQPQNPEFRINPENFHPCLSSLFIMHIADHEIESAGCFTLIVFYLLCACLYLCSYVSTSLCHGSAWDL